MAYRGENRCHICGEDTRTACPRCGNGVCAAHTLGARAEGASAIRVAQAQRLAKRLGGLAACLDCVEQEIAAARGPQVTIFRGHDPLQVQMLAETLLEEGFDARALGTRNAALIGAGQVIFEQRIEVPASQAEEAKALVEALRSAVETGGPSEGADPGSEPGSEPGTEPGSDPGTESDPTASVRPHDDDRADVQAALPVGRRRHGVAAGVTFVFPGASHVYTRRPLIGLLLAMTFIAGVVLVLGRAPRAGAAMMLGVPLFDLIGGQFAAAAFNRGERMPWPVQLIHGALQAALLGLASAMIGG
jgi:hypothetical protein